MFMKRCFLSNFLFTHTHAVYVLPIKRASNTIGNLQDRLLAWPPYGEKKQSRCNMRKHCTLSGCFLKSAFAMVFKWSISLHHSLLSFMKTIIQLLQHFMKSILSFSDKPSDNLPMLLRSCTTDPAMHQGNLCKGAWELKLWISWWRSYVKALLHVKISSLGP